MRAIVYGLIKICSHGIFKKNNWQWRSWAFRRAGITQSCLLGWIVSMTTVLCAMKCTLKIPYETKMLLHMNPQPYMWVDFAYDIYDIRTCKERFLFFVFQYWDPPSRHRSHVVATQIILLCNLQLLLRLVCIMFMLQSLNLIKFSRYPQAIVCDFVGALKFWQGYLFSWYCDHVCISKSLVVFGFDNLCSNNMWPISTIATINTICTLNTSL